MSCKSQPCLNCKFINIMPWCNKGLSLIYQFIYSSLTKTFRFSIAKAVFDMIFIVKTTVNNFEHWKSGKLSTRSLETSVTLGLRATYVKVALTTNNAIYDKPYMWSGIIMNKNSFALSLESFQMDTFVPVYIFLLTILPFWNILQCLKSFRPSKCKLLYYLLL